jgi:hypothetical protein
MFAAEEMFLRDLDLVAFDLAHLFERFNIDLLQAR